MGPDTKVIDATNRTVVPGFNDAHIHPQELHSVESRLGRVPCGPDHVTTLEDLIAALKRKAAITPKGQWILGERYQDTKLGGHPTRETLDLVSVEHPIYLSHSSGHVAAVNSRALELANVAKSSAALRVPKNQWINAVSFAGGSSVTTCGRNRDRWPMEGEPPADPSISRRQDRLKTLTGHVRVAVRNPHRLRTDSVLGAQPEELLDNRSNPLGDTRVDVGILFELEDRIEDCSVGAERGFFHTGLDRIALGHVSCCGEQLEAGGRNSFNDG